MRTILGYIKFISKRNLIFPAIVLAIMIILLIILPVREILFPSSASDITKIAEGIRDGKQYMNVDINDLHYTGYDFIKGNSPVASYYYILDENNPEPLCLFFLVPVKDNEVPENTLDNFKGKVRVLKNNIYFRQFLNDFSGDVGWSSDGLSDISFGAVLSRYDYHPAIFIILAIVMMIVIIICIIYCIANIINLIDPARHEACRRLHRFGLDASDFKLIDNELKNNCIVRAGSLYVTEHYLVAFSSRSIFVVPLYNIVWIYKYSTLKKFSRNSILSYSVMVVTDPKDHITIPSCTKKDADTVLRYMHRNYTHIAVGYSEENRRMFEKK